MITEHFSLAELTVTSRVDLGNIPDSVAIATLHRLAALLEEVRSLLGDTEIIVSSAFRSAKVNKAFGGKSNSQHLFGAAADFHVKGMSPDEIVRKIVNSNIKYDQIIREFDRWTHISVPNSPNGTHRYSKLVIDKAGVRNFV